MNGTKYLKVMKMSNPNRRRFIILTGINQNEELVYSIYDRAKKVTLGQKVHGKTHAEDVCCNLNHAHQKGHAPVAGLERDHAESLF